MTDGVFKGFYVTYPDLPIMAASDILEMQRESRDDVHKLFRLDRAEMTIISCKHCHKSFVPQDEDWICDYCNISNIIKSK